jgi:hypothetical protein
LELDFQLQIALNVGMLYAAAMLFLLGVWLPNKKIRQSTALPTHERTEELTADFSPKSAVLPKFILFGEEVGEH